MKSLRSGALMMALALAAAAAPSSSFEDIGPTGPLFGGPGGNNPVKRKASKAKKAQKKLEKKGRRAARGKK